MKKYTTIIIVGLLLLGGSATAARAEIKQVEMKIAGYLCGM